MPKTAISHFNADVLRARALVAHGKPLPRNTPAEEMLRSDILRSAWMFAIGALDAYFCDAYTDLLAATIISKQRQPATLLPEFFYEVKVPVRAILEPYSKDNWRWRMAARKIMERENVLSLKAIQFLFNKFFRNDRRFFGDVLSNWIEHPMAKKRCFGITATAFRALSIAGKKTAILAAKQQMEDRFQTLFQRRHDCIHNCDRPRVSPQPLKLAATVSKVIDDAEFLVHRCDEHIDSEFHQFLIGLGISLTNVAQVNYSK